MPTPSSPASNAPTSASPTSASPSTVPPRRFNKEHEDFLKNLLPGFNEYLAKLAKKGGGSQGVKGVKGKQGDWIKTYALNPFIEKFNTHGENSAMLFKRIKKWFWNHGSHAQKSEVKIIHVPSTPTRRRATTARECFGNAFGSEINEKVKVERERAGAPTQMNLSLYRQIRDDMYDNADEDTRATFEEEAKTFNSKIGDRPAQSEIYAYVPKPISQYVSLRIAVDRSQKDITISTGVALKRLCGWDWGGHGDAVFFVLGAYRDQDSDINTFNCTISSECHVEGFKTHIPDIEARLWERFECFAKTALPVKANSTGTSAALSTIDDSASDMKKDEDIIDIPTPPMLAELDGVATAMGSALELGMNEHNDVNSDISGTSNADNSDSMDCMPTSVSATPNNDRSEIPDPKISISSSGPDDRPQQLNLTNEQLTFAIASALSAVNASDSGDGPAITQEQPPKVQRKRSVKKAVIKQASTERLPTVSSTKPVKRKRQERIPPNVEPPSKKPKIPLDPGKRVSAR
ncbi:hypothetical protein F5887DRAFT_1084317 [Amanita rubescens]|nr:hypothetical protein F5887DRAFT_1084317 [Amanita rubescens]